MAMEGQRILAELRSQLVRTEAVLVGVADLKALPAESREGLPCGLVVAVPLAAGIVREIAHGPTEAYALEYELVNRHLNRLTTQAAEYLKQTGFRAMRQRATAASVDKDSLETLLPHKTVATLAGLGWIGKCALLVTTRFGAAVRLATVLTDAPLPPGRPVTKSQCGMCRDCVEACPARAPSGRLWSPGLRREEFFDAVACLGQTNDWAKRLPEGHQHQICGICIAACPYTERYLAGQ